MDLFRIRPPHGTLERAPQTALRPRTRAVDEATERWEGFWCVGDDRYYTRCTHVDGRVEWYAIRDGKVSGVTTGTRRSRVLPMRRHATAMVYVSTRRHQAPVLVGVSRRRAPQLRREGAD